MVQEIDRWVTFQAIALLAERHARGVDLTLEVNVPGLSVGDPEPLELINGKLKRTGVPAHRLIFEVTETAAVINLARAGQFVRDLGAPALPVRAGRLRRRLRLIQLPQASPIRLPQDRRRIR
jgi:EAL domain-containing protein (putative c-di-GMP-specific phosphodiesterase class I)